MKNDVTVTFTHFDRHGYKPGDLLCTSRGFARVYIVETATMATQAGFWRQIEYWLSPRNWL